MFHAATAALLNQGITTKSHSGLHQVFGREFIKTGKISKDLGGSLTQAFELRQASDYEIEAIIEEPVIKEILEKAEKFAAEIEKFLGL